MLTNPDTTEAERRSLAASIRRKAVAFSFVSGVALFVVVLAWDGWLWRRWSIAILVASILNTYLCHRRLLALAWADIPEQLEFLATFLPRFGSGTLIIYAAAIAVAVVGWRGTEASWAFSFAFGMAGLAAQLWLVPEIKDGWRRMRELATG